MKRVLNFMRNPKVAHILVFNDPLDEPKNMPSSKKLYLFRKIVKICFYLAYLLDLIIIVNIADFYKFNSTQLVSHFISFY